MKYGRILAFSAVLFLAFLVSSCAGQYSKDPEIMSLQLWDDGCFTYTETMDTLNDMIELQILSVKQVGAVRSVRKIVGPLCELENPPLSADRAEIQALIDAELIKLIKLQKGLE